MSDRPSIFARLNNWFRWPAPTNGNTPAHSSAIQRVAPTRYSIFRPWARRDAAISGLQQGFMALNELMMTIRDHLDRQNQRQDELLNYLSHLPAALETIPESNRIQTETLHAIRQQMESQGAQQRQLADILSRINDASVGHRESLDALHDRLELLTQHDQAISANLGGVGSAIQSVSQNSQTSAEILQQLRDTMTTHDTQLQQVLRRQSRRFGVLLALVILLILAAVGVAVYLYLVRPR